MTAIREARMLINPLLQQYHCYNQSNRDTIPQTTITISARQMLEELVSQINAPSPIYIFTTQSDGHIVAECTFYISDECLSDTHAHIAYSIPCTNNEQAADSAALSALEPMDRHYNIQLFDYNYNAKVATTDENRATLNKARKLTSAMILTSTTHSTTNQPMICSL